MNVRFYTLSEGCHTLTEDKRFINFITFCILIAGVIVGTQTYDLSEWPLLERVVVVLDWTVLAFFTLEVVLKMLGGGFMPWKYFYSGWNTFDFFIVIGSYVPGTGNMITMLRLLRLLRVLKLVKSLPQLAVIVNAMVMGLSSIGFIGLILLLVFYVFAILG
ncbi:unnamed protein product [Discosporangium mesarthrocarpum]